MLNLPLLKVEKTIEDTERYVFVAFSDLPPENCCDIPRLVKNGSKRKFYRDLPMHGKNVGIWVDQQRWKCNVCNSTVYQKVPHMCSNHMMTQRLLDYLEVQCLEQTFASLARQLQLSEGLIRKIFRKFAFDKLRNHRVTTPRWMGIDEVHFLSRFRGIITNVEDRTLVDLLPNRSQKAITRYLCGLPDREKIEVVTIDMWDPYRRAVKAILPQAKIVVDRFHITKMANEALERIRKDLRASLSRRGRLTMKNDRWLLLRNPEKLSANRLMMLEAWLANYPQLKAGYEAKEGYRAIWKSQTREEAETAYCEWKAALNPDVAPAFHDLMRAMDNWHDEIFAYFDTHLTNAYTECVNGLGKILNRLGRGYSFEVIRAKMLLNYRIHKVVAPTKRAAWKSALGVSVEVKELEEWLQRAMSVVPGETLGIDISTLRHRMLHSLTHS